MTDRLFNVLFLCTGNSARSILAEAILQREGLGRFRSFSAGSQPKGEVHPLSLKVLQSLNYDVSGFRSKSWEEFSGPDAPVLDFVFTVRSEEHTSELQSLMRISYAVFCLKKKQIAQTTR